MLICNCGGNMNKAQKGFTLIELVVVITILGILAAFALPRFAELQVRARIAAMNGALASLKSAAALAHSVQLTQGVAAGAAISMEGATINMTNGYPNAALADIGVAAGLVDMADTTTALQGYFIPAPAAPGTLTVQSNATNNLCVITYTQPAGPNLPPTFNSAGLTPANCQ